MTNNSGDFGQLMILYKKLLFLNSCGKLLDTHNLRFHFPKNSRSSKDSDGLKSIEMRSQLIQFMKSADTNSRHLIEVTLSYELIFDDNLERIDVEVNTKFQNTNLNNRVDIIPAKFSRSPDSSIKLGISTNPFDLKKILKQLDEEIRKTRAGAYFDLELKLSYKEEELNDKPVNLVLFHKK